MQGWWRWQSSQRTNDNFGNKPAFIALMSTRTALRLGSARPNESDVNSTKEAGPAGSGSNNSVAPRSPIRVPPSMSSLRAGRFRNAWAKAQYAQSAIIACLRHSSSSWGMWPPSRTCASLEAPRTLHMTPHMLRLVRLGNPIPFSRSISASMSFRGAGLGKYDSRRRPPT